MRIAQRSVMVTIALSIATVGAGWAGAGPSRSAVAAATSQIPLLRVGATAFSTLDLTASESPYYFISNGFDPLLRLDKAGKVKPWLATSWTQPNSTTYVFQLRKGVKFWDGNTMTSADVVASLQYGGRKNGFGSLLTVPIASTTASGPNAVTVKLTHPFSAFLSYLADPTAGVLEKKFLNEHKSTYGQPGTLVMATGPWEFTSFDPTTGIEMTANPHWWGGKVPIQKISISFFSSETSRALAMRAGQIDVSPYVGDPRAFASIPGVKVEGSNGCSEYGISMNTKLAPFNDVHVRRAIAYALNRTNVVSAVGGFASPAYTFIPQSALNSLGSKASVTKFVHSLATYKYAANLAQAKKELAQSKYPHGFSTSLLTFVYAGLPMAQGAQVITNELAPLGIKVTINTLPITPYLNDLTTPSKRPGLSFANYGCSNLDPASEQYVTDELGTSNLKSGGYNFANYSASGIDQLITSGSTTSNAAKRLTIYEKLLRTLDADVPYVALTEQGNILAISDKYTWPTYRSWYANYPWALGIHASG